MNKICSTCKVDKDLKEFDKSKMVLSGKRSQCKKCRSDYVKKYRLLNGDKMRRKNKEWELKNPLKILNTSYKSSYGITLEDYEKMALNQSGKCLLCDKVPKGKLCVDHNHNNGKIRGLLCRSCNGALGVIGDSVEGLEKVKNYLILGI